MIPIFFLPFLVVLLISFFGSYWVLPYAFKFIKSSGILGIDQQKEDRPHLPTSGGIPVLFSFVVTLSLVSGLVTFTDFFSFSKLNFELLFAALSSCLIITMIGLLDDVHVNKGSASEVKKEEQIRIGLKQWQKPLFILPAALPLMVVEAGTEVMNLPLIGTVNFGLLFPLLLVPVGLLVVANATNMLAGFNGLESGLGAILLSFTGIFALLQGSYEAGVLALSLAAPLFAFLAYNFYPAEILPGDSLTYLIGAVFFTTIIIGNIERFAILIFMPWIIEGILKMRSGFKASSLGKLQNNGNLKPKHDKIYSLTHLLLRLDLNEKQLVILFYLVQIGLGLFAVMLFL